MKRFITVVLLLTASNLAAQEFWFESAMTESGKKVAPQAIQQFMTKLESKRLQDCGNEQGYTAQQLRDYFLALPIQLGDKSTDNFLILPSRYCGAFFGMHAISYWILRRDKDADFKVLFAGSSDGITLLPSRSHRFFDIDSFYGPNSSRLHFNGSVYEGHDWP